MKARKTASLLIIVMAVAGACALVVFRSVAIEAVYPVENAVRFFTRGVRSWATGVFRASAVLAENERLRNEVGALSVLRGEMVRLKSENASLRKSLGYAEKTHGNWLAAEVLSRYGASAGVCKSIRVDKGSLAGVREGAVVVTPDGLVGSVHSVTPHTSEVSLITGGALKVACEVDTGAASRAYGILVGEGGALVLRHVSGMQAMPLGSKVFTSGRGGVFPRGIEVGVLHVIRVDGRDRLREVEVLPQVEYATVETVFIRHEK